MRNRLNILLLVAFFIAYHVSNLYTATAVVVGGTILSTVIIYCCERKLVISDWLTLASVLFFGGMTLFTHNTDFIKWKVTVAHFAIAAGMAANLIVTKTPTFKRFIGTKVDAPDWLWKKVDLYWIAYNLIMAIANVYMLHTFTDSQWVQFHLFGGTSILLLVVLVQFLYIKKLLRQARSADSYEEPSI